MGKAIQLAEKVPQNSSVYGESQILIQRWQSQWQKHNTLFAQAQAAYKAGRWFKARDLAYQLPRNPYWDAKANPIYYQAKRKIAEVEQQAQPSPSPTPTGIPEAKSESPNPETTPTPEPTPSAEVTPTDSPSPSSEEELNSPEPLPLEP